jgi:hypothetical protein
MNYTGTRPGGVRDLEVYQELAKARREKAAKAAAEKAKRCTRSRKVAAQWA